MAGSEGNDTASALMSLPEVARYLGMKERTIYDWAQTGRIPAFKLGATWRFRRSEIDAWLETQRSGPDVSTGRLPLVPPVEPSVTAWQARQQKEQAHRALTDACRREIKATMRGDPDRTVFVVDQFVDQFGDDVVREVIEQLWQERRVAVDKVRGRDGEKVEVIRRRS